MGGVVVLRGLALDIGGGGVGRLSIFFMCWSLLFARTIVRSRYTPLESIIDLDEPCDGNTDRFESASMRTCSSVVT